MIRTIKIFSILLVAAFLFIGCNQPENLSSIVIQESQLSESDQQLLLNHGIMSHFNYDVNLSPIEFQDLEYKIDYYKDGKYVETIMKSEMRGFTEELKKKKPLIWSRVDGGKNTETWTITFRGTRSSVTVTLPEPVSGIGMRHNISKEDIKLGEEIVLATIFSMKEKEIPDSEETAKITEEKDINETEILKDYSMAYMLKFIFR